ncbi:hypothetical protein FR729_13565 [Vibrio alginolyticus]|uniref:hypothetical protein n=1 Tax=Vibrio alginolyticus TaxID=663 RepID=UPI001427F2A5|nr:hypothetical protein [Vibrio alginolyticus]QIR94023.1 hypothetical protein FR729_13565 [Vibrio alginolyticus]
MATKKNYHMMKWHCVNKLSKQILALLDPTHYPTCSEREKAVALRHANDLLMQLASELASDKK